MTDPREDPVHEALFETRDESSFVATDYSRGPWDPGACHGGPVAALLTRAIERVDDGAWQLARVTLELMRPAPVGAELSIAAQVERPGRLVSVVAASLAVDDTVVARMRSQRIRIDDIGLPDDVPTGGPAPLPPPGTSTPLQMRFPDDRGDVVAFHSEACEHRYVEGTPSDPGPVAVWIRLTVPVVAGEEPSGAQRAVAAADFGNGVSAAIPFEKFTFINPDLSVHLTRPPSGEWIGMRTESHYGALGAGMAESALFDTSGRIGRGVQSLLVTAR